MAITKGSSEICKTPKGISFNQHKGEKNRERGKKKSPDFIRQGVKPMNVQASCRRRIVHILFFLSGIERANCTRNHSLILSSLVMRFRVFIIHN